MSEAQSLQLLRYYNIGSLISVFTLVIVLRKWVKLVTVVLAYPCISLLAFIALWVFRSPSALIIISFVIGFSISGVLQLTLTVMSEFFSERKGQITGFVYTATSVSYTVIPFITGMILKYTGISHVFQLAIAINIISIVLALFVNYRYVRVFRIQSATVRRSLFRLRKVDVQEDFSQS